MKPEQARKIMNEEITKGKIFLGLWMDSPEGTPLYEEMKSAYMDTCRWMWDDEVIDALWADDMRNEDKYNG